MKRVAPGEWGCLSCPAGTSSSSLSLTCSPCPVGAFNPWIGSASCYACPESYYNGEIGATTCQSCPPGYHSNASTSINDCVAPPQKASQAEVSCQAEYVYIGGAFECQ